MNCLFEVGIVLIDQITELLFLEGGIFELNSFQEYCFSIAEVGEGWLEAGLGMLLYALSDRGASDWIGAGSDMLPFAVPVSGVSRFAASKAGVPPLIGDRLLRCGAQHRAFQSRSSCLLRWPFVVRPSFFQLAGVAVQHRYPGAVRQTHPAKQQVLLGRTGRSVSK